jgi:STE24 endopeptidase
MADAFSKLFIAVLALSFGLRAWLATRHLRHIRTHRDAVPEAFAADMPLDVHQTAADYTCAKVRLAVISGAIDLCITLLLTLGGGLDLIWRLAGRLSDASIIHGTVFVAATLLVTSLVSLPASLYATFGIEARYGFNKMTWALWLRDGIKSLLLGAIIGLPLLALILWLMQISGPLWWLWVWCVWSAFSMLMVVIYPTLIAPLFNRFVPLEDGALKARIEALLTRTGFRSQGVFVMDGSTRSNHGNAYFTGFGAAKRIVFFDTLIGRLTPEEIEAVLAHELGHFRLKHVARRIVLTFALSFLGLFVLGALAGAPWFYLGLGMHSSGAAQALILFVLAAPAFTFPLTPLMSSMSRRHEFEADAFAARETDAEALIAALVKLYRDNASTLTPDPLHSAFYDSHPPAALRIAHLKGLSSCR